MCEIRRATSDDLPRIVEMGSHFIQASRYREIIVESPHNMEQTVQWLLASEDNTIFVAAIDGRVQGMLGLATSNHPLSGQRVAYEMFWWVEPAHRGRVGFRLLSAAEHWARASGCHDLHVVAPTPDVERLYDRLGYTRVEVSYAKRLSEE